MPNNFSLFDPTLIALTQATEGQEVTIYLLSTEIAHNLATRPMEHPHNALALSFLRGLDISPETLTADTKKTTVYEITLQMLASDTQTQAEKEIHMMAISNLSLTKHPATNENDPIFEKLAEFCSENCPCDSCQAARLASPKAKPTLH